MDTHLSDMEPEGGKTRLHDTRPAQTLTEARLTTAGTKGDEL